MKKIVILTLMFFVFLSCKTDKKKSNLIKDKKEISIISQTIDSSKNLKKINQKSENLSEENNDIYLKGSFSILYSTDDELQYLVLKKGEKTIDTLNNCSIGLPLKNLGYVVFDFEDSFVFAQSFGSGNPHMIQFYEKETAQNLIKENSAIIDIDSTKQVLLYSENDVPKLNDRMTLFDTKNRKSKNYEFPKEVFGEAEILNRIHLVNLSEKEFIIEFEFNDYKQKKQKKYIR